MKFIKKEIEKTIDNFVTEYYEFQKRYYNYIHYGTTTPPSILNYHYIEGKKPKKRVGKEKIPFYTKLKNGNKYFKHKYKI